MNHTPDPQPPTRHGIPVVPPAMHASLGHLPASASIQDEGPLAALARLIPAGDIPFWRAGVLDIARALGWRWVILGPCLAVIVAPLGVMLSVPIVSGAVVLMYLLKLWVLALGVCITLVVWGHKNAVKRRPGVFCIHCGYDLRGGASAGTCPECGRAYVPGICEEYKQDPAFFRRRFEALRSLPVGMSIGSEGPK